jgi:hypothetical protein
MHVVSRRLPRWLSSVACLWAAILTAPAATVFVEAESFADHGGWTLDTQFIEVMGSPYLLAHGLGKPVKDAETKVIFPQAGRYRVFARTKDWVAQWKAPGAPGKFQLIVDNQLHPHVFGTTNAEWNWESGGVLEIASAGEHTIGLRDLTGFDGRCDALFFSSVGADRAGVQTTALAPETRQERKKLAGLPEHPPETEPFDLVVCGGGYAGLGTAISAARQGLKVALIQNRPVLGGNGSSEIQVWAQGGTRRGLYPRLGEIVEEFADRAKNSPGLAEEFGDARKEAVVRAEKNIALFLNRHVIGVEMQPGSSTQIRSVIALDTRTGEERRFRGKLFADCTGHGTVGALAGASYRMQEEEHLGMSNMWKWEEAKDPSDWPETPWALPLSMNDFPPTKKAEGPVPFWKGEWFWESGFSKHPILELESMRDWNLRAVFGAFTAMKRGEQREKFAGAHLVWVAAIGGTRESRLLTGDVILTREDIVEQRPFPDGCVPTTWDIDLHYPKEQYAKKFPDNPFISRAEFGSGVNKRDGYPVPYRCFYSVNVENLFMAGRCISVTHEALGTVRVMRTCGMMGEVVGKAAYLCVKHASSPRGVYERHLPELKELMQQPGAARRETIHSPLALPANAPKLPPRDFLDITDLAGIVIDDTQAKLTGKWAPAQNLKPFVGPHYLYASGGSDATARFEFVVPAPGRFEVRAAWSPHPNRATRAPCTVMTAAGAKTIELNLQQASEREDGFHSLGIFEFTHTRPGSVTLSAKGANGFVHADCVQVRAAP